MLVLWVGLVAILYAGGITLFYPTILENAAEYEKLLEIYPKELMAAFGIEGSLGDPGTFLNSYVFQFLWPLVAAIAAILAGDARRSRRGERVPGPAALDPPAAAALPDGGDRRSGGGAHGAHGHDDRRDLRWSTCSSSRTSRPTASSLPACTRCCSALAIAGVTTFLAVVFLDRGKAGGLAAAILIVMYLLNIIAAISPDMADLGRLSAFRYFDLKPLIDTGAYPVGDSLLYLAFALGGWLLALWAFRRRDLAA